MAAPFNSIKIIISDIKIFSNNSVKANLLTKNLSFFYKKFNRENVTKTGFQQLFNYNFKLNEENSI